MDNLMSIKELAKSLGKPESTIRTWKRNGLIPACCFFKIGGSVFVLVNKFNEWVASQV